MRLIGDLGLIFIPQQNVKVSHCVVLESRVVQKPWVSKKESVKQLINDPPPPPPPEIQLNFKTDTVKAASSSSENVSSKLEAENLLLRSVNAIEREFWASNETQRQPGLLILAVNHIYKDVYRLPLTLT